MAREPRFQGRKPLNRRNVEESLDFFVVVCLFFNIYLFIYLAVLGLSCHVRALSCGMQDLVS